MGFACAQEISSEDAPQSQVNPIAEDMPPPAQPKQKSVYGGYLNSNRPIGFFVKPEPKAFDRTKLIPLEEPKDSDEDGASKMTDEQAKALAKAKALADIQDEKDLAQAKSDNPVIEVHAGGEEVPLLNAYPRYEDDYLGNQQILPEELMIFFERESASGNSHDVLVPFETPYYGQPTYPPSRSSATFTSE